MNYDISSIKQALDTEVWLEVKRYLLYKASELKDEIVDEKLPASEYKLINLANKKAYLKLAEILEVLMTIKNEKILSEADKKKDSFEVNA